MTKGPPPTPLHVTGPSGVADGSRTSLPEVLSAGATAAVGAVCAAPPVEVSLVRVVARGLRSAGAATHRRARWVRPMSTVGVIGGGPAGLIAAEVLARAGVAVTVHERMPSPGRKFLLAGHGGLNLTHSEDRDRFVTRYGRSADRIAPMLEVFGPDDLREWCAGLGEPTFVGSSGRVFPEAFRATPLFRAWLARLAELGVRIETRQRWTGWTDDHGALSFTRADDRTIEIA